MAIPTEITQALAAAADQIAQARFLLSAERGEASRELSRALASLTRNGEAAAKAADEIVVANYQIENGNIPEAEEEAFIARVKATVRRARQAVSGAKNELANVKAAVATATPLLDSTELSNGLNAAEALITQLDAAVNPPPPSEPEPEP